MDIEQEIKKYGYNTLVEQEKEKLTKLFHSMLDFKQIKYDIAWDFMTLLDYTSNYYNYYRDFFLDTHTSILYHVVRDLYGEEFEDISEIETIRNLREFSLALTERDHSYKEHAYDYLDIELKEGESYSDLVHQKEHEFLLLFREMLDFVQVPYQEEEDFISLKLKVEEAYPWYFNLLFYGLNHYNLRENYIDILTSMEHVYQKLERYKEEYEYQKENYKEEDFSLLDEDISFLDDEE